MSRLPEDIISVLSHVAPIFSARVWPQAQTLLIGALLAPGKRTVSAVLEVMGLGAQPPFQTYHRLLNRCVWSPMAGSPRLLALLVATFAPTGWIVLGLDDTIERRRGDHIRAKGIYRDPVRSSRHHVVKASGLRWLSLMRLTPMGWADRLWALPFMSVLCPSQRYYTQRGRPAVSLLQRAQSMLRVVARWLPGRRMVVVADSSFAALAFLDAVASYVTVVTRLRLDAALYTPAPPRSAHQVGRPRCKGSRLPALQHHLDDPDTPWQTMTIHRWYGRRRRTVEVYSQTAVWYHTGLPPVPIRWLLIRDPHHTFAPQALLSTHLCLSPRQILTFFMQRWAVETTFEEARAHLGMETQRQWNDRAIARTTPVLLALFSLVTLIAHRWVKKRAQGCHATAWYKKVKPTFADALAGIRKQIWATFSTTQPQDDMVKIPRALFNRLIHTVCYPT